MAVPTIAVGDVFRVTFYQTQNAQRIITVFYLKADVLDETLWGIAGPKMAEALTDAFTTGLTFDLWKQLLTQSLTFDYVQVQKIWPDRQVYFRNVLGVTGSIDQDPLPPNSAIVFEKRTLEMDPVGHSDTHLAGMPFASQVDGIVSEEALNNVEDAFTFLVDPGTFLVDDVGAFRWILFNKNDPGTDLDSIVEVQPKDTVRTMHRRTVRLGE